MSVVVPTRNRRAAVSRLLWALAEQTHPLDRFEVIVVADGCRDDTSEVLSRYRGPLSFRLIEQAGHGPASARNSGASEAKGEWLLFLDDDVVPSAELVAAHLRAHHRRPGGLVVGPYPPAHTGSRLLDLEVQSWWRSTFEELLRVGCRHGYTSVLSGNLSLGSDLFEQLGGFDTRFLAHEDFEFGIRAIEADIPIVYAPDALARHYYQADMRFHIKRKADEGRADVMLIDKYPEVAAELPLFRVMHSRAWRDRIIRALALRRFPIGLSTGAFFGLMNAVERVGLPAAWRILKQLLENYAYLRAASELLGGAQPVVSFCRSRVSREVHRGRRLELDLRKGIEEAERQLDRVRPSEVRIRYGSRLIGVIHHRPGAEPLGGVHLRAALVRDMAAPFLEALAMDGSIVEPPDQRVAVMEAIRRLRFWFGPLRPGHMWFEQYSQWERFERPGSSERWSTQQFWEASAGLVLENDVVEEACRQLECRGPARKEAR